MGALNPDYNCFITRNNTAFQVGSIVAQVADATLMAVAVVASFGAAAPAVLAWAGTKMATRAGIHAAATTLKSLGRQGVRVVTRSADEVAGVAGRSAGNLPERVFRVYGDDAKPGGASWSPTDPRTVSNYRAEAGLPSGGSSGSLNSGRFVIEAEIVDPAAIVSRKLADSLDGHSGGIVEYIIPNGINNPGLRVLRVSGANPEF